MKAVLGRIGCEAKPLQRGPGRSNKVLQRRCRARRNIRRHYVKTFGKKE
jgi:hypothetical protein